MEGLKEALDLIQKTAQQAQEATLHRIPDDDRRVLMQIGGVLTEYGVPPKVRAHAVHSLDDLIEYTKSAAESPKTPVVWHDVSGVVLVLDDADRRDRVTFPLTLSERFRKLQSLAKDKPAMQQDKFVKLLRLDLNIEPLIIAKFRKLDWENGDKGTSDVRHGDTRLAKSIVAKVQGIEELPEELAVPVPVYQQTGERQEYLVNCAVEIDAVNRQFQLVPVPDELERVLDLAQQNIRSRLDSELEEAGVPIYYGKP